MGKNNFEFEGRDNCVHYQARDEQIYANKFREEAAPYEAKLRNGIPEFCGNHHVCFCTNVEKINNEEFCDICHGIILNNDHNCKMV